MLNKSGYQVILAISKARKALLRLAQSSFRRPFLSIFVPTVTLRVRFQKVAVFKRHLLEQQSLCLKFFYCMPLSSPSTTKHHRVFVKKIVFNGVSRH